MTDTTKLDIIIEQIYNYATENCVNGKDTIYGVIYRNFISYNRKHDTLDAFEKHEMRYDYINLSRVFYQIFRDTSMFEKAHKDEQIKKIILEVLITSASEKAYIITRIIRDMCINYIPSDKTAQSIFTDLHDFLNSSSYDELMVKLTLAYGGNDISPNGVPRTYGNISLEQFMFMFKRTFKVFEMSFKPIPIPLTDDDRKYISKNFGFDENGKFCLQVKAEPEYKKFTIPKRSGGSEPYMNHLEKRDEFRIYSIR